MGRAVEPRITLTHHRRTCILCKPRAVGSGAHVKQTIEDITINLQFLDDLRIDWLNNIAFYTWIYHIYITLYLLSTYIYIYHIYILYIYIIYIYLISYIYISHIIYIYIYISYIYVYIYIMYHYISFLWNSRTLPLVWLDHWRTWILCIFLPCHGWPRMCLVERCMMPWGKNNPCNCIWEQRARFHFASCR